MNTRPSDQTLRWQRRAFYGGLAVAFLMLLLTGAELLRGWAQSEAATRLTRAAQARGWTLTWDHLHLGYGLTLTIENLRAQGPEASALTLDTLDAQWRLTDLLDNRITPAHLNLEDLDANLHISALNPTRLAQGPRPKAPSPKPKPPSPTIKLKGGALVLRGLPGIDPVHLTELSLEGGPRHQGWSATIGASCEAGCGDATRASGTLDATEGALSAAVDLDAPFPIALSLPGTASDMNLTVQRVSMRAERGLMHIGVGKVALPIDFVPGWQGQIDIERLEGTADNLAALTSPHTLTLHRPRIALARAKGEEEMGPQRRALSPTEALHRRIEALDAIIPRVLPQLDALRVRDGTVILEDRDLRLDGLEGHTPKRGVYTLEGRAVGASFSVTLSQAVPHMEVGFEGLPLRALASLPQVRALFEEKGLLRRAEGSLAGRLAISPREDSVEVPVKTRRRRLGRPVKTTEVPRHGLRLTGALSLEDGVLDIDGLAPTPIEGQRVGLDLDLTWWRPHTEGSGDSLTIDTMTATLPSRVKGAQVRLHTTAEVRHLTTQTPLALSLRVWMDDTRCDVAVGAIPKAMLGNLHDQIRLNGGNFAPDLSLQVDMKSPRDLDLDLKGLPGACRVEDLGRYSPKHLAGNFRHEVREGVSHDGIFVGPGSGQYVPLKATPKHLQVATYITEEGRFYQNKGFDLKLIRGALRLNLDKGRYVYGGSTISQQLVKNLFMTRDKTLSRKLEEAFIVWKMEEVLTKDRILEIYLNVIEFGPDIYGIKRAAKHYFDKDPRQLTLLEGAFLAGLKPRPWLGATFYKKGRTPEAGYWPRRMKSILGRMERGGYLDDEEVKGLTPPYTVYFRSWDGPIPTPEHLDDKAPLHEGPEALDPAPRDGL